MSDKTKTKRMVKKVVEIVVENQREEIASLIKKRDHFEEIIRSGGLR